MVLMVTQAKGINTDTRCRKTMDLATVIGSSSDLDITMTLVAAQATQISMAQIAG